jgi:hypothetical protein
MQPQGENDAFVFMTTSRHRQQMTRYGGHPNVELTHSQQGGYVNHNLHHGLQGPSRSNDRQQQLPKHVLISEVGPEPAQTPSLNNRPPPATSTSSTRSALNPRFDLSSMRGRVLEWDFTDT